MQRVRAGEDGEQRHSKREEREREREEEEMKLDVR